MMTYDLQLFFFFGVANFWRIFNQKYKRGNILLQVPCLKKARKKLAIF